MKTIKENEVSNFLYRDGVYIFEAIDDVGYQEDGRNFINKLIDNIESKLGKSIENINFDDVEELISIILEFKKNEQIYIIEYILDLYSLPDESEHNDKSEIDDVYVKILRDDRFVFAKEVILTFVDCDDISSQSLDEIVENLEKKYNVELYQIAY